jgi:PAS domain S-box-containing protein
MIKKDAKKAKKIFKNANKKQEPIKNLENLNINKNGKKINLNTTGFPFFDEKGNLLGYRGVSTDITRLKDTELKVDNLNNKIFQLKTEISGIVDKRNKKPDLKDNLTPSDEKLSEQEFDAVCVFDEKANIIDCNDVMIKKSGFSKDELLSSNMADFDVLDTKDDISDKIKKAKKNGEAIFKTIHKRKDGSTTFVIEKLEYLKDEKKFKCIVREDQFF